MYKKTIILLIWLFFLPISLENTFTFGQEEKINLNGIWEKSQPARPTNSTVSLNQEGDIITSKFEPMGGCWRDMLFSTSIPPPDEFYYKNKLDFSGKLIDNTIQAKSDICSPFEGTVESGDMKLTVSENGKSLIGSIITDDGQTHPVEYFFKSSLVNEPKIKVNTVKPGYTIGDQVGIFGRITNMGEELNVFVQVRDPSGNPMPQFSVNVPVSSDGAFKTTFDFRNIVINGTYTAFAIYPNATGKDFADFGYGLSSKGPTIADIVVPAGTVAALGAGGILLYKHGYFKRIEQLFNKLFNNESPQETADLPVIYVAVECGLNNPELSKKPDFNRNAIGIDLDRLEQGFSKAVDIILKNRKVIKNVQRDIDFIKWCKEAKENPNKILSKVSDDIINKLLSSVSPYFGKLIVSEISVESDVSVTRDKHKKIRKSVQFNLVPIEPYIEFVLYVNTQKVSSAKFIFTIETYVEVKNLAVNMTSTETGVERELQERPEQNYDKKISIERLLFAISVEFSKLKIATLEKDIDPPVIIGTKKVELKNFGSSHR